MPEVTDIPNPEFPEIVFPVSVQPVEEFKDIPEPRFPVIEFDVKVTLLLVKEKPPRVFELTVLFVI